MIALRFTIGVVWVAFCLIVVGMLWKATDGNPGPPVPLPGMLATAHAAGGLTQGLMWVEADLHAKNVCRDRNFTSNVTGLARSECVSGRAIKSSCRRVTYREDRRRRSNPRRGVCRIIVRYKLHAPRGLDSIWFPAPCHQAGNAVFGWAHYRLSMHAHITGSRRDATAHGDGWYDCRTVRTGREA